MNLTANEKKLFSRLLDELDNNLGNAGCNDLPQEWIDLLTPAEWDKMDRQFHEINGDPEEHRPGHPLLTDFMVLYYIRKKLGV